MKISTRGRYGTRAMIDLAVHFNEGPIRASAIARRQGLSQKYLEALLANLKAAGLVRTVRGKLGGYALARDPRTISILEILRPLGDSVDFVHCTEHPQTCERQTTCPTYGLWQQLSESVSELLTKTSLADLVVQEEREGCRAAL